MGRTRATPVALLAALLGLCVPGPGAASASPGDVLIADRAAGPGSSGAVLRLDPRSGQVSTVAAGGALHDPSDLAFGPDGELYVSDERAAVVHRLDPASGALEVISSGGKLSRPNGLVFAPEGRLYVADPGALLGLGNVFRINPRSGARMDLDLDSLLSRPSGIGIEPRGTVAIADLGLGAVSPPRIAELHSGPWGDRVATLAAGPPLSAPLGIASAADGSVLVADGGGALLVVRPDGGVQTLASGLGAPADVAVNPSGAPLVLDSAGDRVLAVSAGRAESLAAGAPLESPAGIAVEPPRCGGRIATVIGTGGRDRLEATRFGDVVAALGGRDEIKGFNGDDLICGGPGNDRINGGKGTDRLLGGPGRDRLNGSAGTDRLHAGGGRDRCDGRGGRDTGRACELRRAIP
jgi:sugar lactone lactonase YvrE